MDSTRRCCTTSATSCRILYLETHGDMGHGGLLVENRARLGEVLLETVCLALASRRSLAYYHCRIMCVVTSIVFIVTLAAVLLVFGAWVMTFRSLVTWQIQEIRSEEEGTEMIDHGTHDTLDCSSDVLSSDREIGNGPDGGYSAARAEEGASQQIAMFKNMSIPAASGKKEART